MSDEQDEAFIEAEVERAVARYRTVLPAPAFEEMRDALRAALRTHPIGVELVRRAKPAPEVQKSGDVATTARDDKGAEAVGKKRRR